MPVINLALNEASIDAAIREVRAYRDRIETWADRVAHRLADMGYDVAVGIMAGNVYSGETIDSLEVERVGEGRYVLQASSKALAFFEFGAGVRYGYGHPGFPEADEQPSPIGTYGAGHGSDPNGWWYPTDDPALIKWVSADGSTWGHTRGNPPRMPFYRADRAMQDAMLTVAREELRRQ